MTQMITYNVYSTPTANALDLIGVVFGGQETQVSDSPFGRNLYDYTVDKPIYDADTASRLETVLEALSFNDELVTFISNLLQDHPKAVSLIARTDNYGVFHQLNIQLRKEARLELI